MKNIYTVYTVNIIMFWENFKDRDNFLSRSRDYGTYKRWSESWGIELQIVEMNDYVTLI